MSEQQEQQMPSATAAAELGNKLKTLRQERNLSVGEVAERLKLSARQIEALESGNYQGLPEIVFVRGFLRTYARFVEMNETEISDYLDKIAPQQRVSTEVAQRNQKDALVYRDEDKKRVPAWLIGLGAVVVIAGGIFAWQNKSEAETAKQENASANAMENVPASNINASNVAVVAMASDASASNQAASATEKAASAADGIAANELVINIRYRSMLVIKDKNGNELINQIVPANSEHRYKGGAPYNVWIGYALGTKVQYGEQKFAVNKHMVGRKSASLMVGQ
ncbi:MAG: DUF4115 domain-containing protein [Neisseria sp.]|nr:DUF4115 domain-containing protein [Neisseria sp.]